MPPVKRHKRTRIDRACRQRACRQRCPHARSALRAGHEAAAGHGHAAGYGWSAAGAHSTPCMHAIGHPQRAFDVRYGCCQNVTLSTPLFAGHAAATGHGDASRHGNAAGQCSAKRKRTRRFHRSKACSTNKCFYLTRRALRAGHGRPGDGDAAGDGRAAAGDGSPAARNWWPAVSCF